MPRFHFFRKVLDQLRQPFTARGRRKIRIQPSFRLQLEVLEDRITPTTFTVTSSADTPTGLTLRDALTTGGVTLIDFAIPNTDSGYQQDATGVWTISPQTALPQVQSGVTIDGTSQTGYAGKPLIEIDGASASADAAPGMPVDGLQLPYANSTVQGLAINRFSGNGITIFNTGNDTITGNYIGTDPTGTTAEGNGTAGNNSSGVEIDDVPNNTIGGTTAGLANIISGNIGSGVLIAGSGATGNVVQGNFIGTAGNGTSPLPNSGYGVVVYGGATSDTIGDIVGGNTPSAGNTIADNGENGVRVTDATGIAIRANLIGVNGDQGIELDNGGNNARSAPVITAATTGTTTTVTGLLTSAASMTYTLDFYGNTITNPVIVAYLGCTSVTTDGSGFGSFNSVTLPGTTGATDWITATATDSAGNTSTLDYFNPSANNAGSNMDSGGGADQFNASDAITYLGGPLIPNVKIVPIYVADGSTTSAYQSSLTPFFGAVSGSFVSTQLAQYSVPGYTIGAGSEGTPDTSGVSFPPDTTVGSVPAYDDSDAMGGDQFETLINREINAGRVAAPTADTLYAIIVPPGDAVTDGPSSDSINDFLSYHTGFFDTGITGNPGANVYYLVLPDQTSGGPNANFAVAGLTAVQGEESAASHEIAESITDGFPTDGWTLGNDGTAEVADLAANETYTLNGNEYQYLWSNALEGPGHAPPTGSPTLFINQLSPPAVEAFVGGPVATFTDPGVISSPGSFNARVFSFDGTTQSADWTTSISGGANGVYTVNATPPASFLTDQQYGSLDTQTGLYVRVYNGTSGTGVPLSIRYQPFTISSSAGYAALMIYNADNNGIAHNFVLDENNSSSPANFELFDNGQLVFTQPISETTGIQINADPGADSSLAIDYSGGKPTVPITFDGGTGSGTHSLTLENGSFTNATYDLTGPGAGVITLDGQTVTFSDLKPVTSTITAADVTIDLPANAQATLGAATSGYDMIASTNSGFETTSFANPTASLTINTTGGSSLVTLNAMDNGFAPTTETLTGASGDTFQVAPSLNLSASTAVTVSTATLDGTGTIAGSLTVNSDGVLAPSSSGITNGYLDLVGGSSFNVAIGGNTVGSYSQDTVIATGTVTLDTTSGGVALNLTFPSYTPNNGDVYTIIINTSPNAVSGTFAGLPEGHVVGTAGDFLGVRGLTGIITYQAGSNHDSVAIIVASIPHPQGLALADLTRDGKLDLIVTDYADADVSVALGNGDGTFQTPQTFGTNDFPTSVAVGDVNGDGIPDLVVGGSNLGVNVLLGNGNGTFQAAADYSTDGFAPTSVTLADVNGDGKLDIVAASYANNAVVVLLGNGNGTFGAATTFGTGQGPESVAVADVNTDGLPDLITANQLDSTVSVLLGNGNDTFQAAQNFATGTGPFSVAVADVNGDGKLDLVTADVLTNSVSVLLGNGDGTFQAATNFAVGNNPTSVAVADYNADGRPDIIAANNGSSTVSVLLGNGNGTFLPAENFTTGSNPLAVAVADVNRDGSLDIVAASNPSNVTVLLNDQSPSGTANFQPAQNFTTGTGHLSVAVADVNGDGKPDLVVANFNDSTVSVLLGNGDGTFQAAQNFPTGDHPTSVAVADLTGDGKPDLVVANYGFGSNPGSNTVSVLLGNGNGTFQAAVNFPTDFEPFSVAVADFNGDGKPDLVTANRGGNTVSVFLGNGNGTFQAAQNFATGSYPKLVAVADLNGDGKPDLVVANYGFGSNPGSNTVSVLLGNGNGTFQAAVNFPTDFEPFSVAVADVNGDGQPDIVTANRGGNTVSVFLGNGNGTFQTAQNLTVGRVPLSVAVVDVNGDGKLDLVVANYTSDTVGVLLGNGNGTFQAAQNFTVGGGPVSVAVADVNGDGQPDIVTANYNGNTVSVLLQIPGVVFHAPENLTTGPGPLALAAADLTGDGKTDIITANQNNKNGNHSEPGSVSVLLGNGDGTFQTQQSFAVGYDPRALAVADLNGDGKPDLVTANLYSSAGNYTVSVLLGNGNGTFQAAQNFTVGKYPRAVAIADLNGDGKPDLIVANSGANDVSVLLGNGNGTFGPATNFSTGSEPYSIAVADLSGDGKLDLVVDNYGSNSVSVLMNTTPAGAATPSFAAQQTFAVGNAPYAVTVADFNGDGKPDVATVNYRSGTVSVLLGNGNGTFGSAQNFAAGTRLVAIQALDINHDGKMDLAVADLVGGVSVLLGNGDGTFQQAQSLVKDSEAGGVLLADVNGDGQVDVVATIYNRNTVTVLLRSATPPATGAFSPAQNFATGTVPRSAAVADLTGDGKLDLVIANYGDSTVSVLLGNGNGTFQAAQNFATDKGPASVAVADVNGDGKPDLIVANEGGNTVSVLLGNGNGTFQAAQNLATGNAPISVAVAELTGDGKLDIVVANEGSNTVSVFLGNGNGTFQAVQYFATGNAPFSVAVADVNGDGKPDLVVANANSSTVSVLLGNGNGTFQAAQNFATGNTPISVALVDVNGDGKLDIVVANNVSDSVSVLLGNGNGTFQAAVNYSTDGMAPFSVAVADLTGDGKPDLVVANLLSSNVSVLLGNGNGTFQPAQVLGAGIYTDSVVAGDVNGDGLSDIVAVNRTSDTVSVLLGQRR